jgi:hypothetical protein
LRGAAFVAPSLRLLPLAGLAFVLLATEGAVGDWSGTYLARSGVTPGAAAAGYVAFSLLMIIGRTVGDGIVSAVGPRATVGLGALVAAAGLAICAAWPGLVGGVLGFGLVGAGLANVVPVIFSVAGRTGPSSAVGIASAATSGYAGLLTGAGRHRCCRFRCRSTIGNRHASLRGAACGDICFVEGGRPSPVVRARQLRRAGARCSGVYAESAPTPLHPPEQE